jgi:carboxynorspermidine decarboxylase
MIPYEKIPSPAFVLDEDRLIQNLMLLQEVQERAGVSIILALKGFSFWRVFPTIKNYLKGATASSLNEARLIVEEMGVKAHSYAVAYRPEEFSDYLKYSSHLSFNSLSQWNRFKDQVMAHPEPISCGLRVNPEQSNVKVDLYNPGVPGSRLGECVSNLKEGFPSELEGIHFHVLCESSAKDLEEVLEVFESRFGEYLHQVKWVNMGGGHLMTREGYDIDHLVTILKRFKEKYDVEVILEPGSAIAWGAGDLIASVLDIHQSGGIKTAVLDVSFTAHMPDTLEMPYRPEIVGASDPKSGLPTYRIGGVSCLAGDYMMDYSFEKELTVGDKVILKDMMHYTTVKTSMFNGVHHPSYWIAHRDGNLEEVRRFTYEDYKNRMA